MDHIKLGQNTMITININREIVNGKFVIIDGNLLIYNIDDDNPIIEFTILFNGNLNPEYNNPWELCVKNQFSKSWHQVLTLPKFHVNGYINRSIIKWIGENCEKLQFLSSGSKFMLS